MKGAVQQEPAYVIHRRPWRETALLVDLFTLNHGRMSLGFMWRLLMLHPHPG